MKSYSYLDIYVDYEEKHRACAWPKIDQNENSFDAFRDSTTSYKKYLSLFICQRINIQYHKKNI